MSLEYYKENIKSFIFIYILLFFLMGSKEAYHIIAPILFLMFIIALYGKLGCGIVMPWSHSATFYGRIQILIQLSSSLMGFPLEVVECELPVNFGGLTHKVLGERVQ